MEQSIRKRFNEAGQSHVFQFWNDLTADQQEHLLSQLSSIDVERCNRIFTKATASNTTNCAAQTLKPLPENAFDSLMTCPKEQIEQWKSTGLELIAQNKLAVILLAGGQGTRLGSSRPKGCYDIHLPSHKSLFQLQAERILKMQQLASSGNKVVVIPWYVMTSGPTRKETEAFFKEHAYFGLDPHQIMFFNQGVLPAFTNDGKIFLDEKHSLSVAPDGNGGIYAALRNEGVLADLKKRNIPYVHAYCVDNCLVKVADPVFIGYCVSKNVDCGAKAVPKRSPDEPVGVICLRNDKFSVCEYSEIDKKTAESRNPDGSLQFRAGNIANHFYTVDFLNKIESFENELEYHIANKAIKHIDLSTGEKVTPPAPNGIKLELFIFDVFPFTNKLAVLETDRKQEFSPLKNASGSTKGDSPETSRADILAQHKRFAEQAGAIVKTDELEISPLLSYDGEGLEKLNGVVIDKLTLLNTIQDIEALVQ